MPNRLFTLAEARDLIQQVAPLIERFVTKQRRIQELETVMEAIRRSAASNGGSAHADTKEQERETSNLSAELQHILDELNEIGVELKDPLRGLLDFPALRQGRRVYLCWQSGETTIDWWHEIRDGFPGRQPIIDEEWPA
jgi:hypothetical protein